MTQEIEFGMDMQSVMQWHFIYFAYSKAERQAFVFVRFEGSDKEKVLRFSNINHLVPQGQFFFLGQDRFY